MVVIDKNTGKCYENMTKQAVADLIGVHRNTVLNWQLKHSVKNTKRWTIFFQAMKR